MSILKDVEDVLNQNNIHYFKGGNSTDSVFNVPYRGIENRENHINIYISVDEELKMVIFTFLAKANKSVDIEIIRSKILDLNSHLNFGTLSMRNNSNTIEYRTDYQLNEGSFSFKQYTLFIIRCINIYETMQKEDII